MIGRLAQSLDKLRDPRDRLVEIFGLRAAGRRARPEGMIAVLDPDDPDAARERVMRNFVGTPERIPRALDYQCGRAQMLQVRDAGARRIARRMERIAEAYQTRHAGLVRDHARDASAERFAADHELLRIADACDRAAPRVDQN